MLCWRSSFSIGVCAVMRRAAGSGCSAEDEISCSAISAFLRRSRRPFQDKTSSLALPTSSRRDEDCYDGSETAPGVLRWSAEGFHYGRVDGARDGIDLARHVQGNAAGRGKGRVVEGKPAAAGRRRAV